MIIHLKPGYLLKQRGNFSPNFVTLCISHKEKNKEFRTCTFALILFYTLGSCCGPAEFLARCEIVRSNGPPTSPSCEAENQHTWFPVGAFVNKRGDRCH